jgi:hypothetical protein
VEDLLAYRGSANSLADPNDFEASLIEQCRVMMRVKASILIQKMFLHDTSCRVGGGQYGVSADRDRQSIHVPLISIDLRNSRVAGPGCQIMFPQHKCISNQHLDSEVVATSAMRWSDRCHRMHRNGGISRARQTRQTRSFTVSAGLAMSQDGRITLYPIQYRHPTIQPIRMGHPRHTCL